MLNDRTPIVYRERIRTSSLGTAQDCAWNAQFKATAIYLDYVSARTYYLSLSHSLGFLSYHSFAKFVYDCMVVADGCHVCEAHNLSSRRDDDAELPLFHPQLDEKRHATHLGRFGHKWKQFSGDFFGNIFLVCCVHSVLGAIGSRAGQRSARGNIFRTPCKNFLCAAL